jgi:hypothetical protein
MDVRTGNKRCSEILMAFTSIRTTVIHGAIKSVYLVKDCCFWIIYPPECIFHPEDHIVFALVSHRSGYISNTDARLIPVQTRTLDLFSTG